MQVKKQELEPDMEQRTGSKLGKEYIKAVYCHPAYLTYMQNIMRNTGLDEAQTGIKIAGRNIKQESSRKTSISALLTMLKTLTVRNTTNCGKFFKRWEYQTTIHVF